VFDFISDYLRHLLLNNTGVLCICEDNMGKPTIKASKHQDVGGKVEGVSKTTRSGRQVKKRHFLGDTTTDDGSQKKKTKNLPSTPACKVVLEPLPPTGEN
jgi:hypothetical protein